MLLRSILIYRPLSCIDVQLIAQQPKEVRLLVRSKPDSNTVAQFNSTESTRVVFVVASLSDTKALQSVWDKRAERARERESAITDWC
jgi:hypothetical protein